MVRLEMSDEESALVRRILDSIADSDYDKDYHDKSQLPPVAVGNHWS